VFQIQGNFVPSENTDLEIFGNDILKKKKNPVDPAEARV
jgi:hypothetical protein